MQELRCWTLFARRQPFSFSDELNNEQVQYIGARGKLGMYAMWNCAIVLVIWIDDVVYFVPNTNYSRCMCVGEWETRLHVWNSHSMCSLSLLLPYTRALYHTRLTIAHGYAIVSLTALPCVYSQTFVLCASFTVDERPPHSTAQRKYKVRSHWRTIEREWCTMTKTGFTRRPNMFQKCGSIRPF